MAKVVKSITLSLNLISKIVGKCFGVIIILFVTFSQQSCNNEIDVFTEYKEQAVVYGLLDLSQQTQYLKIGRTFLNPNASAHQVAQIKDSLYFEDATVKLVEEQTGREIIFHPTDSIPKDSGFFQNSSNIIYASHDSIFPKYSYRLWIKDNKTGYSATGRTVIVERPVINYPVSNANPFWSVSPKLNINLRFVNGLHAKSQDAFFEFWVAEFPESDTTQTTIKKITWRFASNIVNESGAPYLPANCITVVPGVGFFDFFLGNMDNGVFNTDPAIQRRIVRTDFILISASQDLSDYVAASTPSIGIVQKQTDYSNIENGLGLFTSRNTSRVSKITIDPASIEFFNSPTYPKYRVLRMIQ
ncbi:MAG: hypothetical protein LC109_05590 [Bacteroidia bacterium]|nr:DUF4249 family protein [Bacteroidia bacterium]MCO5252842.1 hypothetical protein [Bacteroidota bacterium]MCZ2129724.1 hypothetical protein [Bacteroidia bacterium]